MYLYLPKIVCRASNCESFLRRFPTEGSFTASVREGWDRLSALQEQERRTAVGSLQCSNLEEELVRLSLRDRISARETPGKEKDKPGGVFCPGVSPWDE